MMILPFKKTQGFTLVELLVVITIIGILAGLVLSILNGPLYRNKAEDSVRQATLNNLVTGVSSFVASRGTFPIDTNNDGNPLNDNTGLEVYVNNWPLDALYQYKSYPNDVLCISVPMATDPSKYFKFVSKPVSGNNPACSGLIAKECATSCLVDEILDCVTRDGSPC